MAKFLLAIDSKETEKRSVVLAAEGKVLAPHQAQGMSAEEILNYLYKQVIHTRIDGGWRTPFDTAHLRSAKLMRDLADAKTRTVVAEAGAKLTPPPAKNPGALCIGG